MRNVTKDMPANSLPDGCALSGSVDQDDVRVDFDLVLVKA